MGLLSTPRSYFGVHSLAPYSRVDNSFYGILRNLKDCSISLSADIAELTGGAQKFPWAVEEGLMKAEMTLKTGSWPNFIYQLFLGMAPTDYSADALASVTTLTNSKSTSVLNATTGIASVLVKTGSEADVKFGKYTVVAASATTVDVYLSSDIDISRGNVAAYQNDALKVTVTPLTITAATPVTIPNCGLTLTGGSGTIGMTSGDTATFMARPQNNGGMTVDIGSYLTQQFPEFGALAYANKRGTGEMLEVDCYRCKGAGSDLPFAAMAWAENSVKIKLLYDDVKDKVMSVRFTKPKTFI